MRLFTLSLNHPSRVIRHHWTEQNISSKIKSQNLQRKKSQNLAFFKGVWRLYPLLLLLFTAFVKLDMFTVNMLYSLIH